MHRAFEAAPVEPGVVVIPWRSTTAGVAIWAQALPEDARKAPPMDAGELHPAMGPLEPGPAPSAAAALAQSIGFPVIGEALTRMGRWRTGESAVRRHELECFLLRVDGDVSPGGGRWRNVREWSRAWEAGCAYPGPLLTAALETLREVPPQGPLLTERFRALSLVTHPRVAPDVEIIALRTPTLPPATHTNCVLAGREAAVIVDPASPYPDEQERLRLHLEARMAEGVALSRIVLTHHHMDHVGGVEALREAFDVPVAAHALTAELLKGRVRVDEFLADGDRIPLGGGRLLQVLHTPGHAPGHLVFHSEEGGWMIAGDMVAGRGTIVIDPPEGNMIDYLAQLTRMQELGARMMIPSHGPMILAVQEWIQDLIDHRAWREGVILDALTEEAGLLMDVLVARAYGDVLPMVHPIAARQVLAILEKLISEGRVERSPGPRWSRTEFPPDSR